MVDNYKGTIAGFVSSGLTTFASWKTFVKGVLNGFTADYNLYDGAILIGIILAVMSIFLIVKDVVDGGRFSFRERQKATKAIMIMLLLFSAGWFVAKYWAGAYDLQDIYSNEDGAGDLKTGASGVYWAGPAQVLYTEMTITPNTGYVSCGAANDTDYTSIRLISNQSHLTWAVMKQYRGFNLTLNQDGVTKVAMLFKDPNDGETTLMNTEDDTTKTDLADLGTTTSVNFTWDYTDVLQWMSSHPYNDVGDCLYFRFYINADFVETDGVVIDWHWRVTGSDLSYLIVVACWLGFGLIPFLIMTNIISKARSRRGYSKSYRKKRYYRRRR